MFNSQLNVTTSTTVNIDSSFEDTGVHNIDVGRIFFEYLFCQEDSLKNKNKFIFLFLQTCIAQKNIDVLSRILGDPAMSDLHPSLIKSALIMARGVSGIESTFEKLEELYKVIVKNY